MPLSLNNNRGSVYSAQMKIEVSERYCLTAKFAGSSKESASLFENSRDLVPGVVTPIQKYSNSWQGGCAWRDSGGQRHLCMQCLISPHAFEHVHGKCFTTAITCIQCTCY